MLKHIFILLTLIILSCTKDKIEKKQTSKDLEDIKVSININNDEKDVSISRELIIDFSDKVLKLDGSQIDDKNMGEVFSFREGDNKGKEVVFNLNIGNDKKKITIKPNNLLKKSTKYYFQIDGKKLKGADGEKVLSKEIFFTTGDINATGDIKVAINISNDQKNVKILKEIIIDFSSKVLKLDGSEINNKNMGEVLSFRENSNKGQEVVFNLSIGNDKKQIKIKPNVLRKSTKYYFQVDGKKLKGKNGEKVIDKEIFFTTEGDFIGLFEIKDPLYKDQWYLKNTGQFGGKPGTDINIEPVWRRGNAGQGIKIGVIDYLVDHKHPDLSDNLPSGNLDNVKGADICDFNHGTKVAGLIAARDNNIGIRGVAYRSELYSYTFGVNNKNFPIGLKKDIIRIFNRSESRQIAVYNGSLGTAINFMFSLSYLDDKLKEAFDKVTKEGFYGKGSSLVFAAGNTAMATSSNEAFLNHHATIAVNSISKDEKIIPSGSMKAGGTVGTNIWLASPSKLGRFFGNMISTDNVGDCGGKGDYGNFGMTSAAAPLVSGIVAILRQINSNLTWRDIKIILAESAKKLKNSRWQETGRMYSNGDVQKYDRYIGFGLVDASAASQLAKNWRLLPPMKKIELENKNMISTEKMDVTHSTTINVSSSDIKFIESVNIEIDFATKKQENLWQKYFELSLVSPDGKQAWFYKDLYESNEIFTFFEEDEKKLRYSSNRFLGSANINGNWVLKLKQAAKQKNEKTYINQIKGWKLIIRGH